MAGKGGTITIDHVAAASGVSRQTVSRVINNGPNVKPAVRDRILAAIEHLGYVPNLAARRMGGARSYLILAINDRQRTIHNWQSGLGNDWVDQMLCGGMLTCEERGYHMLFELVDTGHDLACRQVERALAALRPDGVILTPPHTANAGLAQMLRDKGIPYGRIGAPPSGDGINVFMDDSAAARDATQHLLDISHRGIAFISGSEVYAASDARLGGYRDAMQRAGIMPDARFVEHGDFSFGSGVAAMDRLLALSEPPTAVIASNDEMAFAALHVASARGKAVPADLSIISFDDTPGVRFSVPPLTAIRQPIADLAGKVSSLLIDAANGSATIGNHQLPYELVPAQHHSPAPSMTQRMADRSPARFALLYALANVGAFICFIPLIGLLLPQKAMMLAPGTGVRLLSWILLAGAIGASVGNIAAGRLSDRLMQRQGSRLPMVGVGLAATLASFVAIAAAATPGALLAAFLLFQLCFNLLFAPFNVLATDHVTDAMKGRVFGLLSLGLPLSQLVIVAIVALDIETMAARLALIAATATATILPLLLLGRKAAGGAIGSDVGDARHRTGLAPVETLPRDFALAWAGRLLIQCAAVAASSYLLIHLTGMAGRHRAGGDAETWFSRLSLTSLVIGLAVGMAIGRWSDHASRRRPFLSATALLVAVGCAAVGVGETWLSTAVGYAIFAVGLTGFLTIDGAVIAQLIGSAGNRGSRLGIMNLTNTLPALLVPAATLTLDWATPGATASLFLCVAAGALIAAVLASMIRTIA